MFVQIIQGKVADRDAVKAALDRWTSELAPGAPGWLGTTAGVADDGTLTVLARFTSRAAARANSERAEQGRWWSEVEPLFTGEVSFHDCADAGTWLGGGSDDAGFVQIMESRVRDATALRAWYDHQDGKALMEFRPEIIGGLWAAHGDGVVTEAVYFTSESAARDGERKEPGPEMTALMEELRQFYEGEATFTDLHAPWLDSPTDY